MRKNSCEGNHIDLLNVWDNSSKANIDISFDSQGYLSI